MFKSEHAALGWNKSSTNRKTVLYADEAQSWNDLHARFEMKRINHHEAYSLDGAFRPEKAAMLFGQPALHPTVGYFA